MILIIIIKKVFEGLWASASDSDVTWFESQPRVGLLTWNIGYTDLFGNEIGCLAILDNRIRGRLLCRLCMLSISQQLNITQSRLHSHCCGKLLEKNCCMGRWSLIPWMSLSWGSKPLQVHAEVKHNDLLDA